MGRKTRRKAPKVSRAGATGQGTTASPLRSLENAAAPLPPRAGGDERARGHLLSVDVLRGFTIIWILGGDGIVEALGRIARRSGPFLSRIGDGATYQMMHAQWDGFRFYDLIFPMFVFLTGLSIVLSLGRLVQRQGKGAAYARLARRAVSLIVLGIIVGGGLAKLWPDVRLMGVLQRIGLCYLVAGLLYLHLDWRGLLGATATILVGYWALLTFVPVPGLGHASYSEAANLVQWVDQAFLPGRRWYGTWDPEGLLGTVPGVATCLIGVLAGLVLTDKRLDERLRGQILVGAGLGCLMAGYAWGLQFPIIKKLWTSSYVLVSGGWSLILIGLLHRFVDVQGYKRWAMPLAWIGANAITLYLIQNLVGFEGFAKRIAGGDVRAFFDGVFGADAGLLAIRLIALALVLATARFLFRRGIFLRV